MSFAFKMKLLFELLERHLQFFNLGHSSLVSTFHPMAFSVGGEVTEHGGWGRERGLCLALPPPHSPTDFSEGLTESSLRGFSASLNIYMEQSLLPPPR